MSIDESFHANSRLEYIRIHNCENLKSIPKGLYSLSCLKEFELLNCPSFVSFPERGLPISISRLAIHSCENLKALPDDMHKLGSLRDLTIGKRPGVESFPGEGFPSCITTLEIEDSKIYKTLRQWGLHRLISFTSPKILGCDNNAESFPDEEMGMMLPTSLTRLTISGFQKLRRLSSISFQGLNSLESLSIDDCPKLKSLSQLGLPPSVLTLNISGCSLLKKRCKRDKGKDWSKIAHIPYVKIDGQCIFKQEEKE